VNVQDAYLFTPLHEAALKRKPDMCVLLLRHGADRNLTNRDGLTAAQLVANDSSLADLLQGEVALLQAARLGDLPRVRLIVESLDGLIDINCQDTVSGRRSTPLHLAAGYNHMGVAEFLIECGAQSDKRDDGGLVPLHNASSYGVKFYYIC
jgi:tankyrase